MWPFRRSKSGNDLGIDFSPLRKSIPEAARAFFASCRERAPGETFYGLAMCVDSDVSSFYWKANTNEALDRAARKWLAEVSAKHPESNYTVESAMEMDRFRPPDWVYGERNEDRVVPARVAATKSLGKVFESFGRKCWTERAQLKHADTYRKLCLNTLADGLSDYDATGEISAMVDRDQFILLVFESGPSNPELIRDIARRLNPPAAFEPFSRRFFADSTDDSQQGNPEG